ncbi:MAG: SDR family oxidoreductase [Caldilineaceae bacterium]|nr:SDR family oxidoreductase [Caldilineaceae bacterium]
MDSKMTQGLLAGHVALVTGGARGVGAATCRLLAANGCAVAVNYLKNQVQAESIAAEIRGAGGQAVAVQADVTQEDALQRVRVEVESQLGPIDVLVNNAWPGWKGGAVDEVGWDTYTWYFEQIVHAAYNTVRAVLPSMKATKWGRIINIGTTSMYTLNLDHTPYISAKGALLAMTRGLATDLGSHNICVNMISPGLVNPGPGTPPEGWGQPHVSRTALGRNPTAIDVAGAVVFLASPLADAITGAHIPVCSGMLMHVG